MLAKNNTIGSDLILFIDYVLRLVNNKLYQM